MLSAASSATALTALLVPLVTLPLAAQESVPQGQPQAQQGLRVVVTGSNIKRVDREGPSPVLTITRQEIERSGAGSLQELLRGLTVNSGGSVQENTFGSFAPGSAGISLRGLGQSSALVLVNGRRVANYGFTQNIQDAFVDLNSLPLSAIERVEVLKDGASSVYGSDAIAGVVNIITRKGFIGGEVNLEYGSAITGNDAGGAGGEPDRSNVNATIGFGDIEKDRFTATLTVEREDSDALFLRDRTFSRSSDFTRFGGADMRSPVGNPGTAVYLSGPFAGLPTALPGCPADRLVDLGIMPGLDYCAYDPNEDITAIPEMRRESISGVLEIALGNNWEWFVEGGYAKNESRFEYAPMGMDFSTAFFFPMGDPFSPVPGEDIIVLRRLTEFGNRVNVTENEFHRLLTGLRGTWGAWDIDTAFGESRSKVIDRGANYALIGDIYAAIGSGAFDVASNNPDSVVDPLKYDTWRTGESRLNTIDFKAARDLAYLEHGALGFATGIEYAREKLTLRSDAASQTGNVLSAVSFSDVDGKRDRWSVYAELDWPFAANAEANLALRYDRYEDESSDASGTQKYDTWNPRLALSWKPIATLKLRGTVGSGFRAPSLTEKYIAGQGTVVNVVDTTACAGGGSCSLQQVSSIVNGNYRLKPEESESWTVGAVWDVVPGVAASIDFWNIEHKNKIVNSAQYVLDLEEQGSPLIGGALVGRDGFGNLLGVMAPYFNIARQEASGVDLGLDVRYRSGAVLYTFDGQLTYLDKLDQTFSPDSDSTNQAGKANVEGVFSYPRVRLVANFGIDYGAWRGNLVARYNSAMSETYTTSMGTRATRDTGRMTVWDVQGSYAFAGMSGITPTLTVGIRNLFDEEPPLALSAPEGYLVSLHDPTGRFLYARLKLAF